MIATPPNPNNDNDILNEDIYMVKYCHEATAFGKQKPQTQPVMVISFKVLNLS